MLSLPGKSGTIIAAGCAIPGENAFQKRSNQRGVVRVFLRVRVLWGSSAILNARSCGWRAASMWTRVKDEHRLMLGPTFHTRAVQQNLCANQSNLDSGNDFCIYSYCRMNGDCWEYAKVWKSMEAQAKTPPIVSL